MKRNTKQLIPMILVFTIIAAAYSCRILAMLDIGGAWMSYTRAALVILDEILVTSDWGTTVPLVSSFRAKREIFLADR